MMCTNYKSYIATINNFFALTFYLSCNDTICWPI